MSSQKTRLIIGLVAVVVLLGAFGLSKSYNAKKEEQDVYKRQILQIGHRCALLQMICSLKLFLI